MSVIWVFAIQRRQCHVRTLWVHTLAPARLATPVKTARLVSNPLSKRNTCVIDTIYMLYYSFTSCQRSPKDVSCVLAP